MSNGRKGSKSFWDRRKELNKEFGYEELANLKKLVLVRKGEDEYSYDDTEYIVELIDRPTKYNLQGEKVLNSKWYKHVVNDDHRFNMEWGCTKTKKEINKLLRDQGYAIKEILTLKDSDSVF